MRKQVVKAPRLPALLALTMLGNNHGDASTVSENPAMPAGAGVANCEILR